MPLASSRATGSATALDEPTQHHRARPTTDRFPRARVKEASYAPRGGLRVRLEDDSPARDVGVEAHVWKIEAGGVRLHELDERSMKPCIRSTTPVACGSRRIAEVPVDTERPAERRELVCRPAVGGVQPRLAIPDQRLRQRAQRPQTATDAGQQVRGLLGEEQRAGASAQVAQARDHDPALGVWR